MTQQKRSAGAAAAVRASGREVQSGGAGCVGKVERLRAQRQYARAPRRFRRGTPRVTPSCRRSCAFVRAPRHRRGERRRDGRLRSHPLRRKSNPPTPKRSSSNGAGKLPVLRGSRSRVRRRGEERLQHRHDARLRGDVKRGGAGVVFRGDVHVVQAGQRVHQMEVPAARGAVQARPPAAAAEGILSTRNPFARRLNLRARRRFL